MNIVPRLKNYTSKLVWDSDIEAKNGYDVLGSKLAIPLEFSFTEVSGKCAGSISAISQNISLDSTQTVNITKPNYLSLDLDYSINLGDFSADLYKGKVLKTPFDLTDELTCSAYVNSSFVACSGDLCGTFVNSVVVTFADGTDLELFGSHRFFALSGVSANCPFTYSMDNYPETVEVDFDHVKFIPQYGGGSTLVLPSISPALYLNLAGAE